MTATDAAERVAALEADIVCYQARHAELEARIQEQQDRVRTLEADRARILERAARGGDVTTLRDKNRSAIADAEQDVADAQETRQMVAGLLKAAQQDRAAAVRAEEAARAAAILEEAASFAQTVGGHCQTLADELEALAERYETAGSLQGSAAVRSDIRSFARSVRAHLAILRV